MRITGSDVLIGTTGAVSTGDDGAELSTNGGTFDFARNVGGGSAVFRVYGNGGIARSRPYIGSGSPRKLSGAAESLTFNPDEKQMLFSFLGQGKVTKTKSKVGQGTVKTLGNGIDRFSPVYIGSGTAKVLGDATVVRARDFVGFGSLRKLSGAAESLPSIHLRSKCYSPLLEKVFKQGLPDLSVKVELLQSEELREIHYLHLRNNQELKLILQEIVLISVSMHIKVLEEYQMLIMQMMHMLLLKEIDHHW